MSKLPTYIAYIIPGSTRTVNLQTTLNANGKTCVLCDICNSTILLTPTGGLRFFETHRNSNNCLIQKRRQERLSYDRLTMHQVCVPHCESLTNSSSASQLHSMHQYCQLRSSSISICVICCVYSAVTNYHFPLFRPLSIGTTPSASRDATPSTSHVPTPAASCAATPHPPILDAGFTASASQPVPATILADNVLLPLDDDAAMSDSEQSVDSIMVALDQLRTSSPSDLHLDNPHSSSDSDSDECDENECTGVLVEWMAGSVWDTYPYHQHGTQNLAWYPMGFTDNDKWLHLCAKSCKVILTRDDELNRRCCSECAKVPHSAAFITFRQRAVDASEHTP